ncbi:MAG TPA: hypothetical protein VI434_10155 [Candidatus Dormibacteraeota bacterium]
MSVEAAFLVVVEASDDDEDVDESLLLASDLAAAPFSELLLESLLTDVIEEDSEPRLSVL